MRRSGTDASRRKWVPGPVSSRFRDAAGRVRPGVPLKMGPASRRSRGRDAGTRPVPLRPGPAKHLCFQLSRKERGRRLYLLGDARNGNKIYCLIEERKGRERKVKSCSRDERSRDRKWITICEPKVTGTLNGFEFGNRKEREPEMFRDASRIRFCVPHPEGKTGGASRRKRVPFSKLTS